METYWVTYIFLMANYSIFMVIGIFHLYRAAQIYGCIPKRCIAKVHQQSVLGNECVIIISINSNTNIQYAGHWEYETVTTEMVCMHIKNMAHGSWIMAHGQDWHECAVNLYAIVITAHYNKDIISIIIACFPSLSI